MRAFFDSNVYDKVIDTPGALVEVQTAVDRGVLRIITTYVVEEELAATPDEIRRSLLLEALVHLNAEEVNAYGFRLGFAKLGKLRLPAEGVLEALNPGRGPEIKPDAVIAATSAAEPAADVLVTEAPRCARKAKGQGIAIWTFGDLLQHVQGHTAPTP